MKDTQGNEIKLNEQYIFWDDNMIGFHTEEIIEVNEGHYQPYICDDGSYENCIPATQENFLKKLKEADLKKQLKTLWG